MSELVDEAPAKAFELLLADLRRYPHHELYRLLIERGEDFAPAPLPPDITKGTPKQCYSNAYKLAVRHEGRLTYYEGVATSWENPNVALGHSWCIDARRSVVDPTWHEMPRVTPAAYRGIAIPLDVAKEHAVPGSSGTFAALGYDMTVFAAALGVQPPDVA